NDGVTWDLNAGTITDLGGDDMNTFLGESGMNANNVHIGTRIFIHHGTDGALGHKVNGIWEVTTFTSISDWVLTRAADMNVGAHHRPNAQVWISDGDSANNSYIMTADHDVMLRAQTGHAIVTLAGSPAVGDTTITVSADLDDPDADSIYEPSANETSSVVVGQGVKIGNYWYTVATAPADGTATFTISSPGLREAAATGEPIRSGIAMIGDDASDSGGRINAAWNTWTHSGGGLSTTLADGSVFIGNGSHKATARTITGDVSISNTGVTTIAALAVDNAMLAGSIADSKLNQITTADKVDVAAIDLDGATDIGAALVDADLILVDDGAGGINRKSTLECVSDLTYSKVSGDATVAAGGALTIAALAVDNSMLAGSIANAKLSNSTISGVSLGGALGAVKFGPELTSDATVAYGLKMSQAAEVTDANDVFFFCGDVSGQIPMVRAATSVGTADEIEVSTATLSDGTTYELYVVHNDATNGDSVDFQGTGVWRTSGTKFDTLEGTNHGLTEAASEYIVFALPNGTTTRTSASVNLNLDGNITGGSTTATGTFTGSSSVTAGGGTPDTLIGVQLYNEGENVAPITVSSLYTQYNGAEGATLNINYNTSTFEVGSSSGTFDIKDNSVSNQMLAGSIANDKLQNSTVSGVALGANLNAATFGSGLWAGYGGVTANDNVTITDNNHAVFFAASGQAVKFVSYATGMSDNNSIEIADGLADGTYTLAVVDTSTTPHSLVYNQSGISFDGTTNERFTAPSHNLSFAHMQFLCFALTSGAAARASTYVDLSADVSNDTAIVGAVTGGANIVVGDHILGVDVYPVDTADPTARTVSSVDEATYNGSAAQTIEMDVNGLTGESAVVEADELAFYDASATALRKITWTQICDKLAGSNITNNSGVLDAGAFDIGALGAESGIVGVDLLVFEDATDTTQKKITLTQVGDVLAGTGITNTAGVLSLESNAITTSMVTDANITHEKIENSAGFSIIGRAATGSGVVADIALSAGQVLGRTWASGDVASTATPEVTGVAVGTSATQKVTINTGNGASNAGTFTINVDNGLTGTLDFSATKTVSIAGAVTVTNDMVFGSTNGGTLDFGAASKTLTVADDCTVNQNLRTTDSVTFVDVTTTSDVKFKNDVQTIEDAVGMVNKMRGATWIWNEKLNNKTLVGKKSSGVIAQEINEVLPCAIKTTKDGELSVNYNALSGLLIESIKSLSTENKSLKSDLQALKAQVQTLSVGLDLNSPTTVTQA
ncbi:tail fiber domain-containing protein, partial [bacterium]|nr:tail fiber domain-containing protein [bacterium]